MEKIKKVFSPGSSQDDEIMYGDPQTRTENSASNQAQHDISQLHPVEDSEKKESGGVLRQIINPGSKKHDDVAYGTTATTAEPERDSSKLKTDPDHKDKSILQKIFSRDDKKHNEGAHSTTTQEISGGNTEPAADDSGLGRDAAVGGGAAAAVGGAAAFGTTRGRNDDTLVTQQGPSTTTTTTTTTRTSTATLPSKPTDSYHPGRDASSAQSGTFATAPGTSTSGSLPSQPTHNYHPGRDARPGQSPLPIHDRYSSGGVGSSGAPAPGSTQGTLQSEEAHGSSLGRNAAIIGGGAAALDAGGYAAREHANRGTDPTLRASGQTDGLADGRTSNQAAQEQSGSHGAGRDAGMSSTSGIPPVTAQKLEAGSGVPGSSTASGVPSTSAIGSGTSAGSGFTEQLGAGHARSAGHINPVGAPESQSSYSNAGIAGGLGAAGAAAAYGVHNNAGGSTPTQLNRAPDDVQQATYLDRSYYMGTSPHIPGEFPTSTGEDVHRSGNLATGRSDPATIGAAAAMRSHDPALSSANTTTNTSQSDTASSDHHTGRNTALAGGALGAGALAGGAVYGATRDRDVSAAQPSTLQQTSDITFINQTHQASSATSATAPVSRAQARTVSERMQPQAQEHHHGRDAAFVGGAGAVGAGEIYAATRDRNEPGTTLQSSQSGSAVMPQSSAPATYDQATRPGEQFRPAGVVPQSSTPATHDQTTRPGEQSRPTAVMPRSSGPATYDQSNRPGEQFRPLVGSTSATSGGASTQQSAPVAASTTTKPQEHHYGRDAAVAGGAGVLGAGGIYAATRDRHPAADTTHEAYGAGDPNAHNKLHKPSPDDKQLHKEEQERQHAAEKAQKKHDKEHQKELEKAEKKHEKEEAKHEKEIEKQRAKEEKDSKPSLIDRIFHRHYDGKEDQTEEKNHAKEYLQPMPVGGTTDVTGNHPHTPAEVEYTENRLNHPLVERVEHHGVQGGAEGGFVGEPGVAGPDYEAIRRADAS